MFASLPRSLKRLCGRSYSRALKEERKPARKPASLILDNRTLGLRDTLSRNPGALNQTLTPGPRNKKQTRRSVSPVQRILLSHTQGAKASDLGVADDLLRGRSGALRRNARSTTKCAVPKKFLV